MSFHTRSAGRTPRESISNETEKVNKGQGGRASDAFEKKTDPSRKKSSEKSTELGEYRAELISLFQDLDAKVTEKLEKIDNNSKSIVKEIKEIRTDITELKREITETEKSTTTLEKKVSHFETTLNFQEEIFDKKIEEQKESLEKMKSEMQEKLVELERKFMFMEKHDRKYNLLFYGIDEYNGESVYEKLREMFVTDLHLDEDRVQNMYFANGHRIPSEGPGPRPIILKFTSFEDRQLVLANSYKLVGTRKRILTDLPVPMKKERGRVAKIAYDIRQKEKLQTRIIDKGLDIMLQVRKNSKDKWETRKC